MAGRGAEFAARPVAVAAPGVDRRRGGGRVRRGGRRADRRCPSIARRAGQAAGRGGGGRTGFEVAGAADLELVAVSARGFGAGATPALGASGSDHSGYSAGPVGVLVPEPVGSGVGAGVRAVVSGVGFGVGVRFAFRFGVGLFLGVAVALRVVVGFVIAVAVRFRVTVGFTVCFVIAIAVCVLLAVGFLLVVIFGFVVTVGFLVRVSVRARFGVRVGEFELIRYWVSGCFVAGLAACSCLAGRLPGHV